MTSGGVPPEPVGPPDEPRLTLRERFSVIGRRLSRYGPVREVQALLTAVGEASGPLLAAGLAFNALFAIIPALLFVVGLLGFVLSDPAEAQRLVESVVSRVPALADFADTVLGQLVEGRGALSVVGVIGFAWGASGFYGSLDEAMRRIFPGGAPRSVIQQRVRGVIAVAALVGAALAAVLATSLVSFLDAALLLPAGFELVQVLGILITIVLFVIVVLLTYLLVPVMSPGLSAALLPAILAGTGIGLLTALFSVLAPVLVGRLSGLGLLATVFGALVWLRLVFEVLIYGAAWARMRRDRSRRMTEAPHLGAT